MNRSHDTLRDFFSQLPRLGAIALVIGTGVVAVDRVSAGADVPLVADLLVGGEIAKPSGVGFVLAVTMQRNQ